MSKASLFAPTTILKYPNGFAPGQLRHIFDQNLRKGTDGSSIDFRKAQRLLEELRCTIAQEYKRETGDEFNGFALGDRSDSIRRRFWEDMRFKDALNVLGHDISQAEKIRIPWWNEIAASEAGHEFQGDSATVLLTPRHSYETQLMRSGVSIGIRNVSVGGIVITSDGLVAIGLRAGATLPNTYHVAAGALGLTPGIMAGASSMYDFFVAYELGPEFGVRRNDVIEASVVSRTETNTGDMDVMYTFHVRTNLGRGALNARYEGNFDADRGEHTRLVFIKDDPAALWEFIKAHYRGLAANNEQRPDSERLLLHSGALPLAAYAGRKIGELAALFVEGLH